MTKERGEVAVGLPHEAYPKLFTFDTVYDPNTKQEDIFNETAYPIIDNVFEGYNGTIFAYGQTGTGKSHTMSGVLDNQEHWGIIPRSFDTIFKTINCETKKQFLVRVSYLEIYNEEVYDLLSPSFQSKLELKEKPDSGVYVKDLSTFVVKNPEDTLKVMRKGTDNRHTGETNMNKDSSRSHSVFCVTIEQSEIGPDGKSHIKVGKLNMVDLAGSERQ